MNESRDPSRWVPPLHKEPLLELKDKVKPEHTALVVVDMQNDFCADGGMMSKDGVDLTHVQAMADRLVTLLDSARKAGVFVVFVRNVYSTSANHYLSDSWLEQASRRFTGETYTIRDACPPDSWESDFFGDVRPVADEPVVTKHRYNAFHGTDLDLILRTHGIRTLVLTGVATNVCVETTARDGFVRDYYIVLPSDGAASWSQDAHEATLKNIDLFFGQVATIDALREIWEPATSEESAEPISASTQPVPGR